MAQEKKLVYRAGLIPYTVDNGTVRMKFMKPSNPEYGGDTFQIAKGRVEEGEDDKGAAIREAREELGLFIGNTTLTESVGTFMGRTAVFVSKVKDPELFGLPDDETSEVAWLTVEQFDEIGRDLHKPVVHAAMRKIAKLERL